MADLRRGFKKECEEYAAEFREELGLGQPDPLPASKLADLLDLPVIALSRFDGIPAHEKIRFLSQNHSSEFSATVLKIGSRRVILHNDCHTPVRQNSNIMHEIAHTVLRHPLTAPLNGAELRSYDNMIELEAKELSFALLIPKIAALMALERFADLDAAAEFYGVSRALLQYRIRITNSDGWAKSRARFRA